MVAASLAFLLFSAGITILALTVNVRASSGASNERSHKIATRRLGSTRFFEVTAPAAMDSVVNEIFIGLHSDNTVTNIACTSRRRSRGNGFMHFLWDAKLLSLKYLIAMILF
jgi:hypothetical protein